MDGERRAHLDEIARACEWVPANPPRTFFEALQFFYFVHLVRYLEFSTLGIGIRFDHLFGRYYDQDLEAGRITPEGGIELLQLLWVKLLELGIVWSPLVSSVYGGVASLQGVTLGGTDEHGRDVTNAMTYLVLDAAASMRTIEPSIALRIHDGTPDELLSRAVDVIGTGYGLPVAHSLGWCLYTYL